MMSIAGFEEERWEVGEASYFVAQRGEGTPILLLHGFPQSTTTLPGGHFIPEESPRELSQELLRFLGS